MHDDDYMRLALELALKAKGRTSPNPLVGAIVVKNRTIVGRGFHQRCGAAHAEVIALQQAGVYAKGATLYVTLEPCGHFGRTPPCIDVIIQKGIKRVVVGTKDPNPINNGKSIRRLRHAGIQVDTGYLQKDLRKINEYFFKFIQKRMPFVVVKWAQTLDGKIALSNGNSQWITSATSRKRAHQLRNNFDAILVGINTVLKDNPALNASGRKKRLKKIIVDSRLRIPLEGKWYARTEADDIIVATTARASQKKKRDLSRKRITVITCPDRQGLVDLDFLFRKLASRNIASIFIEGGARIIGSVLKQKLADKAYVFIAPKIMGDQKALSAVDGLMVHHMNKILYVQRLQVSTIGRDLFIEADIIKE